MSVAPQQLAGAEVAVGRWEGHKVRVELTDGRRVPAWGVLVGEAAELQAALSAAASAGPRRDG